VRARSCAELAELRSAFVDDALADADRERLLVHLVDCASCRREVAELRHVRSLLTGSTDPGTAPLDLSHRLVSIAGDEATEPLWTRPFRRTAGGGELPSQRLRLRTRVVAGALGCGLTVLAVLGIGYAVAPDTDTARALDPTRQAVTEFTSVVSAFPLDGRVSAALQGRPATSGSGGGRPTAINSAAKKLSEVKAAKLLVRAGQAGDDLTYTAVQQVRVSRDDQQLASSVQVSSRGGTGTRLDPSGSGHQPAGYVTWVQADSSTRMADADLIDLLTDRYTLRGWVSQTYAGRAAVVIEATEPTAQPADGDLDGVVARWWLDADTTLLLGQETYDGRGHLDVASELTDLRYGTVSDQNSNTEQGGTTGQGGTAGAPAARTTTTLTLSRAAELRRDGWVCAERLAGLSLMRLRTDRTDDPELVHLVYSDGLTTLSVIEQRGRLSGSPAGSTRNETLGAWVTGGMPTTASWVSGDVVMTVVTDGSRETLAAAVAALPHDASQRPTTMERVRAGWSRILGR
jgi:anti-sigma factor RsiW